MKKIPAKKTAVKSRRTKSRLSQTARPPHRMVSENAIDISLLDRDILEKSRDREFVPSEMEPEPSHTANWGEVQDRGDDLANMRDPFVQGPERDAIIF